MVEYKEETSRLKKEAILVWGTAESVIMNCAGSPNNHAVFHWLAPTSQKHGCR